jgi:hypothetical protein
MTYINLYPDQDVDQENESNRLNLYTSLDCNASGRELDMELEKSYGAQKKRQGRENIKKMNLNVFRFLE